MKKKNIADEPEMKEIENILDTMTEAERRRTLKHINGRRARAKRSAIRRSKKRKFHSRDKP